MKYRRAETFRYVFQEKINCICKLLRLNDIEQKNIEYEGQLVDVSPSGFKFFSSANIPTGNDTLCLLEFTIIDREFKFQADFVWKCESGNGYNFGLKHNGTSDETRLLIDTLKLYAKEAINKK